MKILDSITQELAVTFNSLFLSGKATKRQVEWKLNDIKQLISVAYMAFLLLSLTFLKGWVLWVLIIALTLVYGALNWFVVKVRTLLLDLLYSDEGVDENGDIANNLTTSIIKLTELIGKFKENNEKMKKG